MDNCEPASGLKSDSDICKKNLATDFDLIASDSHCSEQMEQLAKLQPPPFPWFLVPQTVVT